MTVLDLIKKSAIMLNIKEVLQDEDITLLNFYCVLNIYYIYLNL